MDEFCEQAVTGLTDAGRHWDAIDLAARWIAHERNAGAGAGLAAALVAAANANLALNEVIQAVEIDSSAQTMLREALDVSVQAAQAGQDVAAARAMQARALEALAFAAGDNARFAEAAQLLQQVIALRSQSPDACAETRRRDYENLALALELAGDGAGAQSARAMVQATAPPASTQSESGGDC